MVQGLNVEALTIIRTPPQIVLVISDPIALWFRVMRLSEMRVCLEGPR